MTALCFVDANIFVYARDVRDLRKRDVAAGLLESLWANQTGRTSVQAVNEFYSTVTRKLKLSISPAQVWAEVELLFVWNPLPVDEVVVRRANKIESRYRLNWWDALIVAAAQLQGCRFLYSEDLQHGAVYDSVQVRNPFLEQVNEPPPPDYMSPRRTAPHRPRGRPRKTALVP